MNRIISNILTLCLLIIASAAFATDVTHRIPDKVGDGSIKLAPGNKVGTSDDGIVYTCYGSSTFSSVNYTVCVHLHNGAGDSIIISPPLNKLAQLTIVPYSRTGKEGIKVYVSEDGAPWTDSGVTMTSDATAFYATIPVRAYKLKITAAKAVDIIQFRYTYLDCNCFTATP